MLPQACVGEASEDGHRFTVKIFASFDELPASYQELISDMGKENFASSLHWFSAFAGTAMQAGAALRLYGVETKLGGAARGLLVAQSPAARRGAILRNRHIGRRTLSGLTGYQTYLFAPLLHDHDPHFDEILHCLARHLRSERPRWEMIDFAAMDRDARSFDALVRALRSAGFVVRTYPHFANIFDPTSGQNYAAYFASRPPSARKQIKKYESKERQLEKSGAFRAELIAGEAGLDQALLDFAAVFEASWKEPDHHPDFLPACIRASAKAGSLRLLTIYLDNKPAATYLAFLAGKRATFYRTAYHPDYARQAVGAIVKLRMVRHLLNVDHIIEMDFGRDREAYKRTWGSGERMRCGILTFNCATAGGLGGLAEQLVFELRDWFGRASRPLRDRFEELRARQDTQDEQN